MSTFAVPSITRWPRAAVATVWLLAAILTITIAAALTVGRVVKTRTIVRPAAAVAPTVGCQLKRPC